MSSSIEVRIVKDEPEIKEGTTLLVLYTSSTIELTRSVALEWDNGARGPGSGNWNDGWFDLDSKLLEEILKFYQDEIASYKDLYTQRKNDILRIEELLPKVTTGAIYEKMREEIENNESSIQGILEEIDILEHFYNCWKYSVQRVWSENKHTKLIYYYSV